LTKKEKEKQIKDLESTRDKIKKDLLEETPEEKDKMKNARLTTHLDILQRKIDKLTKGK
jgi:hypothetical protein